MRSVALFDFTGDGKNEVCFQGHRRLDIHFSQIHLVWCVEILYVVYVPDAVFISASCWI